MGNSTECYTFALYSDHEMRIVTLTTDFGQRDYSVAAVKGKLYSAMPEVNIVDISHLVAPFDILQASFILKNAYHHFPKGSIHIIGVDAERTPEKKHLLMLLNGHYFIGADNGIFHLLAENKPKVELYEIGADEPATLFPTLYFFPKVAEKLYNNVPLNKIGKKTDKLVEVKYFKPEISADNTFIYGTIIYIDHYGNAVSNITRTLFEEIDKGRRFEIIFNMYAFDKIYNKYSDIIDFTTEKNLRHPDGKRMLLFNDLDYLQLSIYKSDLETVGGASTLLGVKNFDQVSVHFF